MRAPESHGNYIGTSSPIDFHRYTLAVEHQTAFNPRTIFAVLGKAEVPVYQQDENGRSVPILVMEQMGLKQAGPVLSCR
ncbi:hypothetical protein [Hymenobacter sp. CRA2]|uniref:hypothetical protein n=1 Tax=Hymenobacter sp. CRA2 TaxID=1955620 RepID=UPI00098F38CB|nr:hypothetical protein [Hymenobacter sp. CRA2]OON67080.1 hypothetical protein B0919_19805 [Hymenobacter sp. CRA2]